jgi:organic hydroperoxide reductase OsmC/OhrA
MASHEHSAEVEWTRGASEPFVDNRYNRRHVLRFDGGAEVAGSSAPSSVRVPLSDPSAVDPEELLVAAVASCHMLWFLSLAAKAGFLVDSYHDAAIGTQGRNAEGHDYLALVILRPDVRFSGERIPTHEEIESLHHQAHERCFIAYSVRAEVRCEPVFGHNLLATPAAKNHRSPSQNPE